MAPPPPGSLPLTTILFDLDDTLFDHLGTARAALAATCAEQPALQGVSIAELSGYYGELLEEIHPQLLAGRYTVAEARQLRFERLLAPYGLLSAEAGLVAERHYGHYRRLRRCLPGALALLQALKRAPGYQVGIVTNNRQLEQEDKLRALGLAGLVDALVTSEALAITKPDPRIFAAALARLGSEPARAVMVGDNWLADVEGALAAGIRPVWLNREGRSAPRPGIAELRALEPLPLALAAITGV